MIVDASVWVSYFVPSDKFHSQTIAWLEGLDHTAALLAPMLVVPEVAGAVSRRTQNAVLAREIVQQILAWPTLRLVPMSETIVMLAGEVAVALSLKGADAIYVSTALAEAVPLVTWDVEQLARGRSIVSTHAPGDLQV